MLNKLERFLRRYDMVQPGDTVICAVSGGADSVALLFALYLLRDKLSITVSASHFNHHLRGEESDRDECFVRRLCDRLDVQLYLGGEQVTAGKKGLEAAARDARYSFLRKLSGKIATAHTADDNAETVLMHMVRGTGLRGLGGITPVCGNLIRPMLSITRDEIITFLAEYHLDYVQDSSNDTEVFLRNRLRHCVMPLLKAENPSLAENMSEMALRLRQDEEVLQSLSTGVEINASALRQAPAALRSRAMSAFLERCGVPEPEAQHIAMLEKLVFSTKPSAEAYFPGGITVRREYGCLTVMPKADTFMPVELPCPGSVELSECGLRVTASCAQALCNTPDTFTVKPEGKIILRSRQPGDAMKLSGGTKELKKLFIDRKIPAAKRMAVPVVTDDAGVLGVYGIGMNLARGASRLPAVQIRFEAL